MKKVNFTLVNLTMTIIMTFFLSFSTYAQFSGGSGLEEDPYIITTAEQLAQLATFVNAGNVNYNNKHYKLGNDIDLSDYQSGTGWTPIGKYITGTDNQPFKGVFNGDNHKIYALKINNNAAFDDAGLFGYVLDCTIKNIGIENALIESINETSCAGGIASYCINSNISHCYFAGDITNTATMNISYVGGIAGYGNGSHFSNCCSSGSINGIANSFMNHLCSTGGVVGGCDNGSVSNCFSIASVTSVSTGACDAGGVIGYGFGSSYVSCYSTGTVSATASVDGYNSFIGGIIGSCYDENISNCAALNPVLNCNSVSSIMIGRINGYNYGVTLSNNIAFDGMLNHLGNTTWTPIGATTINGADISVEEIHADGTLGGRFTNANGWITQNGKLPVLFGNPMDMPEHLQLPGLPIITTTAIPDGTVGVEFYFELIAEGDLPITWTLEAGALPPELTLSEDGVISGIPTTAGTFTFTVKATNNVGYDTKELSIEIVNPLIPPTITTTTLPDGTVGIAYSQLLEATGTPTILWTLETEALPPGLTLSEDGVISGIPTITGTFTFTVKATNDAGSDTKELSIYVGGVGIVETWYAASVRVYPNPTTGELWVECRDAINGVSTGIEIFDVMGRTVRANPCVRPVETDNYPSLQYDITSLPVGVYFLRIQTENETVTRKIIKN